MNNILIIGSGGREHAICWKIAQSSSINEIFIAPGNAGTEKIGTNVSIPIDDFNSLAAFCIENEVFYIIVGPEQPLVDGIFDFFKDNYPDINVLGPSKAAAQLEGSKKFAKEFMASNNIPTAAYQAFSNNQIPEAKAFISNNNGPYVLKADGLAAGKGVLIIENQEEALVEIESMLGGKFGNASKTVVIEAFLSGIEFSVFVLTDGNNYQILPVAKDYKRIGEGDTGLNTGGMGAISPVPFVDEVMMNKVEDRIIKPTISGIQKADLEYKGFIFLGLINVEGDPFVIEYNCRMGDPETEVVIPRIENDLMDLFKSVFDGNLTDHPIKQSENFAAGMVLVSGGYPEKYEKGKTINIHNSYDDSVIFHAGTKSQDEKIVTNGGRVMCITSFGNDILSALDKSKTQAENIDFEGKYYRKDIGLDLI